jgi:DNA-binding response OmpR family regulator
MRILVVEDEKDIRDFLKKSLESECYAVDTASDGAEGSYMARTNDYDLIILDNNMPRKIGMEVCEEIRRDKNTPILILSVKSETTSKVDLLNSGADDYLTKPFALDELMARVKALLRRPKTIQRDIVQIDDMIVDFSKQTVVRGGEDIYLTRKEFNLLKYLLNNRGIALSRSMIMEHVWDMSADPFSNTIESHILSLRKKINGNGLKKLIHTVPGRGYVMDDKK